MRAVLVDRIARCDCRHPPWYLLVMVEAAAEMPALQIERWRRGFATDCVGQSATIGEHLQRKRRACAWSCAWRARSGRLRAPQYRPAHMLRHQCLSGDEHHPAVPGRGRCAARAISTATVKPARRLAGRPAGGAVRCDHRAWSSPLPGLSARQSAQDRFANAHRLVGEGGGIGLHINSSAASASWCQALAANVRRA